MTPLRLHQSGEYDADFEVVLEADGRFSIERGGYVTGGRRYGMLTSRQQRTIRRLVAAVGLEGEHLSEGSMQSVLEVGPATVRWSGPPPTAELKALVSALIQL